MWETGAILVKEYVSNEEFNKFCIEQSAIEGCRRLDPPNEDQVEFHFDKFGEHSATSVKIRDRDLENTLLSIEDYADEIEILEGNPMTWIEVAITTKQPSEEDNLNFYNMCSSIMKQWHSVLSDINGTAKSFVGVTNIIQEINRVRESL